VKQKDIYVSLRTATPGAQIPVETSMCTIREEEGLEILFKGEEDI
jgi:hypothetical protein